MSERGALRELRVLMWVVIAIEVPVYLVWLVEVGYLTGQELPRGDVARWAPPVLLPPAAVLFCVMAGWTWWLSVVAGTRSALRERWIVASLVFVAAFSVFCGVASVDDPSVSVGLLSAAVTGLGMTGLFFIPAAASRELPASSGGAPVIRRPLPARRTRTPSRTAVGLPGAPRGGHAARSARRRGERVSEDDDATAAETSLRRAVEQLCGDGAGAGGEARPGGRPGAL
ncbi:hypothetical protein ABZ154_32460 [Streptomyces sp. NPDC006261]|uniref:hypothetical protein n=1 Tax=Streptomyces sp. NPDC006261 TaxID=3156739 RepID=UPI0033AB709E